jgi:hypothetical protein
MMLGVGYFCLGCATVFAKVKRIVVYAVHSMHGCELAGQPFLLFLTAVKLSH